MELALKGSKIRGKGAILEGGPGWDVWGDKELTARPSRPCLQGEKLVF
jgi:hypothetical protein